MTEWLRALSARSARNQFSPRLEGISSPLGEGPSYVAAVSRFALSSFLKAVRFERRVRGDSWASMPMSSVLT